MKSIPLTKDKVALVDDDDYEWLRQYKWCYCVAYAMRRSKTTRQAVWMHREINKTPKHLQTDHINGNKLDNRKENLRSCTAQQNIFNKHPQKSKSGYRGVYWDVAMEKWRAYIILSPNMTGTKNKNLYLGAYRDKLEAAWIQNTVRLQIYGEYAKDDFPSNIC